VPAPGADVHVCPDAVAGEPERQVPPFVFSRYQKLNAYGWPVVRAGEQSCQIDESRVVRRWKRPDCRLAASAVLMTVLRVELA